MTKKNNNNKKLLVLIILILVAGMTVGGYLLLSSDTFKNSQDQSKNCKTFQGTIGKQCAEDYEGLSLNEAVKKAQGNGLSPKTIKKDGKVQGFTDDGSNAIYFEANSNVVTTAYFEEDRPIF